MPNQTSPGGRWNHSPSRPRSWLLLVIIALAGVASPGAVAQGASVTLVSGDVLHGIILDEKPSRVELLHPDLGRIVIMRSRVASIDHDAPMEHQGPEAPEPDSDIDDEPATGAVAEESAQLAEATAQDHQPPRSKQSRFFSGDWTTSFVLGGTTSNDDDGEKVSINMRLNVARIKPGHETYLNLAYIFKLTNDVVDDNELTASLRQRFRTVGSPWYTSGKARYDYNEFRSWTQRVQGHGSVGYFFVENEDIRFSLEGGAGLRKDFGSDEERLVIEGLFGPDVDWFINRQNRLTLDLKYYPALEGDDHRVVTGLVWTYTFDEKNNISMNVTIENEYNTDPDPGFPTNNYRLTWGVQLDF